MTAGGRFGSMGLYMGGSAAGVALQALVQPPSHGKANRKQNLKQLIARETLANARHTPQYLVPEHLPQVIVNKMHGTAAQISSQSWDGPAASGASSCNTLPT